MTATPTRRTNIAFHVSDYARLERICDNTGYNKREAVAIALECLERQLRKDMTGRYRDKGSRKRTGGAAT